MLYTRISPQCPFCAAPFSVRWLPSLRAGLFACLLVLVQMTVRGQENAGQVRIAQLIDDSAAMEAALANQSYKEYDPREKDTYYRVYKKQITNGVQFVRMEWREGAKTNNVTIDNQEGSWRINNGSAYLMENSMANKMLDQAGQRPTAPKASTGRVEMLRSLANVKINGEDCYKIDEPVPLDIQNKIIGSVIQSTVVSNLVRTGKISLEQMVPATNVYYVRVADKFMVGQASFNRFGKTIHANFRSDIKLDAVLPDSLFAIPAAYKTVAVADELDYGKKFAANKLARKGVLISPPLDGPISPLSPVKRKMTIALMILLLLMPVIFALKKSAVRPGLPHEK